MLSRISFTLAVVSLMAGRSPAQVDHIDLARRLGAGVSWVVEDPLTLREGRDRRPAAASAHEHADFDRAAALDRVLAVAKESGRPVALYVPRILAGTGGRQMYRPAVLDNYARAVFFSDPICVDLLNRRFVAARLVCDDSIGERLGLVAPVALEPAVLFLDPEGVVRRRIDHIRTFNADWFARTLLAVLEEADDPPASIDAASTAKPDELLAAGRDLVRDGRLEQGLAILSRIVTDAGPETICKARLLEAQALRLLHRFGDALERVDAARAAAESVPRGRRARGQSPLVAAALTARGRILLATGDLDGAADCFVRVTASEHRAEAQFHLGLCDFFGHRDDLVTRRWREAAAADPKSPWSWRAAANLVELPDRLPLGPTHAGFEDPFARNVAPMETTTLSDFSGDPQRLAGHAVSFLLRMQRENGGWTDSRYAYWGAPDYTPNVWVAVTALACEALARWRDLAPEAIDAALERGEAYLLDHRRLAPDLNEEVYARAYQILYLCGKFDRAADDRDRSEALKHMNRAIAGLEGIQRRTEGGAAGFWAHEYPNPFCTAAAINALHRARERGADVPARMMVGGAKALLSVRDDDGAFAYGSRRSKANPATRAARIKDSMGRAPICEAAILWSGVKAGSIENLEVALDRFWEHLPRLARVRECDFHTDGQLAGFFFWNDVFHTTEAIEALPEHERGRHRARFVEFLKTLGEIDGSFIDSHEMGKSYGTAMGLLSLDNVLERQRP